jgi:hypothetical protein
MFSNFLFLENLTVYEIMWKNIVEPGKPQMTIWRMRIVCWVHKATITHSEYVILIDFPLQQWLHESASMLSYAYISRFVCSYVEILHLVCPVIQNPYVCLFKSSYQISHSKTREGITSA